MSCPRFFKISGVGTVIVTFLVCSSPVREVIVRVYSVVLSGETMTQSFVRFCKLPGTGEIFAVTAPRKL